MKIKLLFFMIVFSMFLLTACSDKTIHSSNNSQSENLDNTNNQSDITVQDTELLKLYDYESK